MEVESYVNYYETLGLGPNCDAAEIERAYRDLVRQFHPDNQASGDRARFERILEAHKTLKDADRRARYNEEYRRELAAFSARCEQAGGDAAEPGQATAAAAGAAGTADEPRGDDIGVERDLEVQNRILTLLYVRRRSNIKEPGMGNVELELMSGCPEEHLEFHLWYLREKGWIARQESGLIAITVDGVDRAASMYQGEARRITDQT